MIERAKRALMQKGGVTTKMGADEAKDIYLSQLQEELAREKARSKALIEEFKVDLEAAGEFSPEQLKVKFRELLMVAWERANYLLTQADSEAVQWAVCKYVFQVGLGQTKITNDNDPDKKLNDLLQDLINGTESDTTQDEATAKKEVN